MIFSAHNSLLRATEKYPENIAVSDFSGNQITYEQLDLMSNNLAGFLREIKVRRGDRVAFILPKSVESIISIYGILKIGAAYVPIDVNSPVDRIEDILSDAGVFAIITTSKQLELLEKLQCDINHILLLDKEPVVDKIGYIKLSGPKALNEQKDNFYQVETISSDLAYLIYTSGSTGRPKGVAITHANLINLILWSRKFLKLNEKDRFLSHGPMSFDITVLDVYATLDSGAALYQFPVERMVLPKDHLQMAKDEKITIWNSVPSLLSYIINLHALKENAIPSLRKLIFIGEVMPTPHLRLWMEAFPKTEFINMYGPSEATFAVSYYIVPSPPKDDDLTIPIGKALPNIEIFAVKDDNKKAGVDEKGELYIRGASVGAGYFRRPELNEKYFVQNPFSDFPEKVYRTGDLVILNHDNDYVFCGRNDYQVKVMGRRMELGEVESAIYSQNDVKECCVIAASRKTDMPKELAAYVVSDKYSKERLVKKLSRLLPEYMVPKHFFNLPNLPKTSNGKIDRVELTRSFINKFSSKDNG